jgi:serine/threonine-protein kinase RsbT
MHEQPRHFYDVRFESDVLVAARGGLELAAVVGFDRRGCGEVGIIVSELASNAFKYAGGGRVVMRALSADGRRGIEVAVEDDGPGIPSLEMALRDGFSEGRRAIDLAPGDPPRRGLGDGLGAVERLSHELEAQTRPEGGMRMVARKWLALPGGASR